MLWQILHTPRVRRTGKSKFCPTGVFPLDWEGRRQGRSPPLPSWESPGRGRVRRDAAPPGLAGWRAQAPAGPRQRSAASPSSEEGRRRGCPGRPGELASQALSSRDRGPAVRPPGARERPAASARPWAAGCRRGERRAGAARALCSSGARCPRLILHSRCLSLPASPSSQSCGEESETWLKSPSSDLLQRPPHTHTTTPFP